MLLRQAKGGIQDAPNGALFTIIDVLQTGYSYKELKYVVLL